MNTSAIWAALRRWWRPSMEESPAKIADDTKITGEAAVRRVLERLARNGVLLTLHSDEGAFDQVARLTGCSPQGVTLQLQPGEDKGLDSVPLALNATACTELGVLLFSLHKLELDAEGLLHAPWPQQLVQVQSRRHFRVTGLNGQHFHAELVLPEEGRVPRLRNLSEEGLAFDKAGPGVPYGTLIHNATLKLDGARIEVPVMQVMYCREFGDYCAVGAHFEIVVADEARLLRRWIAAAQAAMLMAHTAK